MICHGVQTRARSTEIIGTWRNLQTRESVTVMLPVQDNRAPYVSMLTGSTDTLSLCIERALDMAALTPGLQVPRNLFRQRSDFRKCGLADITLEQVRGKGEGRPCEKRCTAEY